jgi:hypothetical protein
MRRNLCHCVRLVLLIPVVYLLRQTESVWRRYRVLSEKANRQKRGMTVQSVQSTWHVRTADVGQPGGDTWQIGMTTRGSIRERHVAGLYGGHVASPGRNTCQVDLAFSAYSWTSYEVTHVTTHRVTRGMMTSSSDVAADRTYGHADIARQVAVWSDDRWRTAGDVAHTWANHRPTRGILSLVDKGATWPNQGLPHGTQLLVFGSYVKMLFWLGRGSNP